MTPLAIHLLDRIFNRHGQHGRARLHRFRHAGANRPVRHERPYAVMHHAPNSRRSCNTHSPSPTECCRSLPPAVTDFTLCRPYSATNVWQRSNILLLRRREQMSAISSHGIERFQGMDEYRLVPQPQVLLALRSSHSRSAARRHNDDAPSCNCILPCPQPPRRKLRFRPSSPMTSRQNHPCTIIPLYCAFSNSFGLAKIIRPAEVCSTLVTSTSIVMPM